LGESFSCTRGGGGRTSNRNPSRAMITRSVKIFCTRNSSYVSPSCTKLPSIMQNRCLPTSAIDVRWSFLASASTARRYASARASATAGADVAGLVIGGSAITRDCGCGGANS
jgi:hypothetical protein